MTVGECYEDQIDRDELFDKASESDYWESCDTFVEQVWERDVETISPKQREWLDKIAEGLGQ